jgi:hypothetical protein
MALTRLDQRSSLGSGQHLWLMCPVRNELPLLPDFMRHYRSIGIEVFCFIDNDSDDGSREYLLSQPDCIVFYTDESYREANFAADWINRLIKELDFSGWLILADADEHLCYPGIENRRIQALLADYEGLGFDAVYAVMVDMYPATDFMSLRINPGDRLLRLMPYFDTDYIFRRLPLPPWMKYDNLQVIGGPRCRLLSTLAAERRRGWLFNTFVNQVDRFVDYIPQNLMPTFAACWPCQIPAQIKTPINLVRPGFRFYNSHASTNLRFAHNLTSLLHFKFCSELQVRMSMTFTEGNHYRRGLSYMQLQQAVRRWGKGDLMYEGSRRYVTSSDLDEAGLIGQSAASVWTSGFRREFRTSAPRDDAALVTKSTGMPHLSSPATPA